MFQVNKSFTSLVYFILFDAIIRGKISLISFLSSSLLIYKNIIDFHISYFSEFIFKNLFKLEDSCLQSCDGYCLTLIWISHRHTFVPSILYPPPSLIHPSRLSQSTSFGRPLSYIKLRVYFTYGTEYVLMLFSQIIPPTPSPTESKSLFFMPVSPLLPCT